MIYGRDIVTKKLRFEVVTVDCPESQEFDLEEWLADILIDYWHSIDREHCDESFVSLGFKTCSQDKK